MYSRYSYVLLRHLFLAKYLLSLKQVATENTTIKGARTLVPTAKEAFS